MDGQSVEMYAISATITTDSPSMGTVGEINLEERTSKTDIVVFSGACPYKEIAIKCVIKSIRVLASLSDLKYNFGSSRICGEWNQSFQLWFHIANMPPLGSQGMPDQDGIVTILKVG